MKNLLFFDLECSNCFGGEGKVCEFGAVLTDENFKIIREYDIPMNPGHRGNCEFDMGIYKRDPEFDWAYDKDFYLECPEFDKYYETIKNLLEDENTIVFGFAVDNDIRYLGSSIKRYKLNQLKYKAFDTLLMVKKHFKNEINGRGLKGVCENVCGKNSMFNFNPHLSRDDAKMTMMMVKKLCEKLDVSSLDLIQLCENCTYDSPEYLEAYEAKKLDRKLHPELYRRRAEGRLKIKSETQVLWGDFYRENLPLLEKEESIGKIVTISAKIKESIETITNTIKAIKDQNLVAFDRITGSDIIVALDDEDKARLESNFKYPYAGKIVVYEDFIKGVR